MPRFAVTLRDIRERELKESQRQFAKRLGISQTQVSTYENGREVPTRAVLERIAERLGRPVADIDPDGEAYKSTGPRRRQTDELGRVKSGLTPKEVTVDDPRRFEFVSLFDSLVRDSPAQEELVTIVRRYVARRLGNK